MHNYFSYYNFNLQFILKKFTNLMDNIQIKISYFLFIIAHNTNYYSINIYFMNNMHFVKFTMLVPSYI